MTNENRFDWRWKVRTMVNGAWGPWSTERTFDVEPLDTDCAPECTPTLVSPANGSELDNGCSDQSDLVTWEFDWEDCFGATKYHLYALHTGDSIPVIDNDSITTSEYVQSSYAYMTNENRFDWRWKVRTMVNGAWGPWSTERAFDVEPLETDCNSTSINNLINYDSQIIIYPNPTNYMVYIESQSKTNTKIKISVFNNIGRLCFSKKYYLTHNEPIGIDLSDLGEGIYFVEIKDPNTSFIGKVVKK
jgi:hypothetical protein